MLVRLLATLHGQGFLTEDLFVSDFPGQSLEAMYRGLCMCPLQHGQRAVTKRLRRRIGRDSV